MYVPYSAQARQMVSGQGFGQNRRIETANSNPDVADGESTRPDSADTTRSKRGREVHDRSPTEPGARIYYV